MNGKYMLMTTSLEIKDSLESMSNNLQPLTPTGILDENSSSSSWIKFMLLKRKGCSMAYASKSSKC